MLNGRIVELEVVPDDDSVDSELLREAAGIPDDRPLIVQQADGINIQVNPSERVAHHAARGPPVRAQFTKQSKLSPCSGHTPEQGFPSDTIPHFPTTDE